MEVAEGRQSKFKGELEISFQNNEYGYYLLV